MTKIEWTDETWSPITGCSKVSTGCKNCYAERMAPRLAGRFGYPEDDPFSVTLHPDRLNVPFHWRKPRRVFVCSMGDLFHEHVPDEFLHRVLDVIGRAEDHIFQVLTKRPDRMRSFVSESNRLASPGMGWRFGGPFPLPNLWLGVSCEDQQTADERIPILLDTPAAVRFVSLEPLLGPIEFPVDYNINWLGEERHQDCEGCSSTPVRGQPYCPGHDVGGIDWVIAGSESGSRSKRRACNIEWVRSIRDQCVDAGVSFFLKQLHVDGKKVSIPELDGRRWVEVPNVP